MDGSPCDSGKQGDCARYVLFNSWSLSNKNGEDHYYKGVYKKTLQVNFI